MSVFIGGSLGRDNPSFLLLEEGGHIRVVLFLQARVFGPALFVDGHHYVLAQRKTPFTSRPGQSRIRIGSRTRACDHIYQNSWVGTVIWRRWCKELRMSASVGELDMLTNRLEKVWKVVSHKVREGGERFRRFLCRNRHFRRTGGVGGTAAAWRFMETDMPACWARWKKVLMLTLPLPLPGGRRCISYRLLLVVIRIEAGKEGGGSMSGLLLPARRQEQMRGQPSPGSWP